MGRHRVAAVAIGFVALAGAAPAQTPDPYAPGRAIVAEAQRIVTPNGVQETFEAVLGGARQVVNVRGSDRANPILIYVHGGPGAVEMPHAWTFQRPWEDFFTVVQWDQRGAGRSWPLNDPATLERTLTVERYRDDTIELIELLRKRYGQRKVFLLGHSWGSVVGLSVAAKRPDLLHAYIGMGQYIDPVAGERAGYAWTLAQARKDGNVAAVRALEALQPYPGDFAIAKIDAERKWAVRYGALFHRRSDAQFYFDTARLSPDYTPADRKAWGEGSAWTVERVEPLLAKIRFSDIRRLGCPVILLAGRHDWLTPSALAEQWLARLSAPAKRLVWFEQSAHMPMVEEPGRTLAALLHEALPLAAGEAARAR